MFRLFATRGRPFEGNGTVWLLPENPRVACAEYSLPIVKDFLRRRRLDLKRKSSCVKFLHGVVCRIRGTANSIGHDNRPIAEIDRAKNRGQHANIGLAPGNQQRVDPSTVQTVMQLA